MRSRRPPWADGPRGRTATDVKGGGRARGTTAPGAFRGFGTLWTVGTVSGLGDGVTLIAGPLLAASLTRDPVQVAGLLIAQQLPWLLFALPSGALVDRRDRRRLMSAVSLGRAVALAVLGLAVASGHVGLPLLYGVFFLVGCAGLVFENAAATMVPVVVPPDGLERANGRLQATRTVSEQLVAKPLGGWLFGLAASAPFLLDAGALVLVALLSATLPASTPSVAGPRTTIRTAIAEGVRWLVRHRLLRTLAVVVSLSNVGLGAVSSILVLIAYERLGLDSTGFGLLLTALAVGGVLGGVFAGRIIAALGPGTTMRVGLVIECLVHVGAALTHHAGVAALLLGLLGLHLVVFSAIAASLRQKLVPAELLGRVHSAYRLTTNTGMLLGSVLGGVLGRYVGLSAPFWVGAACVAALTVYAWPVLRNRAVSAPE
ncbi:MAG TPA: MFS transporter [Thermomonospora sp.]|nr:MFS transporter [Thermomonospora sp.]